jgi:hypothetical protein
MIAALSACRAGSCGYDRRVRILPILLAIAACGPASRPNAPKPPTSGAARWIPDAATYAVHAASIREAQAALNDLVTTVGPIFGIEPHQVGRAFEEMIAVDATSSDAVAALGIDVDGELAVFSEDLDPTIAVHLAAPDRFAEFLAAQRARGMSTRSVTVDDAEIVAARIEGQHYVAWTIANDWLLVHFTSHPEETEWFSRAKRAGAGFARVAGAAIAARVDLPALARRLRAAGACAMRVRELGHASFVVERAAGKVGLRVAVSPPWTSEIAKHVVAPPPGWSAVADAAAVAVAWNVDLVDVIDTVGSCAPVTFNWFMIGRRLHELHVRAARAAVQSFDPDDPMKASGAVALDLAGPSPIGAVLDDIPLRAQLERDRNFGGYAGKRIAIPLGPTLDYVLTDRIALAAVGDGLLDRMVAPTAARPAPLLAFDARPSMLSTAAWRWIFQRADLRYAQKIAEEIVRWKRVHIAIAVVNHELVLDASAERR